MRAMILAAGFGTRLLPYTQVRPKPLFPVLNRPLLLRLVDDLRAMGCQGLVVNSHHLHAQVAAALAGEADVVLSHEPEILGTGGSPRRVMELFGEAPMLLVNGDVVHDIDLAALYRRHCAGGQRVTLALHDYPRFNKVRVRDGLVRSFTAAGPEDGALLAFTGIHVLDPAILAERAPDRFFSIIDLYTSLIERGEGVAAARVDGCYWLDMGTPEDYLRLHGELLTGRAGPLSWRGEGGACRVHPLASLGRGVELGDWACVGADARIGAGAHLERAVIWDGAEVAPGAVVQDRIVTGGRCGGPVG